ncbi:MAG: LbtU family siderophore porin [Gammaproteobacteria bacterium]|nr:LbtU family siderophore porin [Gammaproteobacteria bacterium]
MKNFVLPMTAIAAFTLSVPSFAADNNADLTAQVNQLSAQTKKLQREVASLRHKKAAPKKVKTAKLQTPVKQLHAEGETKESPAIVSLWNHYVTITTVPYLSRHLAFSGSDLLYNVSSINEDLILLKQKKDLVTAMELAGYPLRRPLVQVSGSVAGQFYSSGAFTQNSTGGSPTSGFNLSTAELDFNAIASRWASGFMALAFNGSPVSTGNRNPNSSIYLQRGFLTIGDLNVFPLYFTIGEMYAPFGAYTSSMVTTPITQSMMEIRTPTAILGYSAGNFFASVFGYGGSQTSGEDAVVKQAGVDAGFKSIFRETDSYSVGTGWVSNIADSQGMQGTGYSTTANQFSGFGATSSSNNLVYPVGAADLNGSLVLGRITFLAEAMSAVTHFSSQDLQFNGGGAMPAAAHGEIDYALPYFAKKYGVAAGASYDHAWQALALNFEENKYAVFLNANIWRETAESLEVNYESDYGVGTTGTGRGAASGALIRGTGLGNISVLADVNVYF